MLLVVMLLLLVVMVTVVLVIVIIITAVINHAVIHVANDIITRSTAISGAGNRIPMLPILSPLNVVKIIVIATRAVGVEAIVVRIIIPRAILPVGIQRFGSNAIIVARMHSAHSSREIKQDQLYVSILTQ